jgi:hypothetical protein
VRASCRRRLIDNQESEGASEARPVRTRALEREKNMPLVNLVIALIVVGMALWVINRFIPMASSIKTILNVVVVVAVCVWVLQATGLWGPLSSYRVGR